MYIAVIQRYHLELGTVSYRLEKILIQLLISEEVLLSFPYQIPISDTRRLIQREIPDCHGTIDLPFLQQTCNDEGEPVHRGNWL